MEHPTPPDQEHVAHPAAPAAALAALDTPAARWFQARFRGPTASQCLAWPALAAGRNLLLSAPTGAGKTLAAFLPVLGRLLEPAAASIRCLYVAPLKALCTDVFRNLSACLDELSAFLPDGVGLPRLGVRTGDTPAGERRTLRHDPPDVLLTTPESLAVLLSQPAAADLFAGLRWVVVDEVHALAATKRGADLSLSLERLSDLASADVQRVGLSATAAPLAEAARFLAGVDRPCAVAQVVEEASMQVRVAPLDGGPGFFGDLLRRLEPELRANPGTLVFTNTRRLAERLAWSLRRRMPDWDDQIAVHHSSLAAERRRDVEERFKHGRLRVVVSSTSLELGVDIGSVDLVVLVHPPGGVVQLLQRVGRGGHGPGRVKHGLVFTANPAELLEAAVTGVSGLAAQLEPLCVPDHPLDVLCQQLAGMAAARSWSADEAFALVRRAYPYRGLSRADFDDCLAYLRGLDRDGRSWLPARLGGDLSTWAIRDQYTARLLRRNLGTILAEERAAVCIQLPCEAGSDEEAIWREVGEVDRAYAERLQPGDRFLLDGRCLEFRRRDGAAVLADEVGGRTAPPRWAGDGWPLSADLARRLFLLRVQAAETLRDGAAALAEMLRRDYGLEGAAAEALAAFFQRQECVSEVPDAAALVVEAVRTDEGVDYYLHTPLNRPANDALARVAVHRLARDGGRSAVLLAADLGFALQVRGELDDPSAAARDLLAADGFAADLDAALETGPTLRERFGRVAQTGLMLLRNPVGGRRRVGGGDWAERRLYDQVLARDPDFVLLRQAWREVQTEVCDVRAAVAFVEELKHRSIRCRRLSRPSPFVEAWTQAVEAPAEAVETPAEALQRLHAALMGEVGGTA